MTDYAALVPEHWKQKLGWDGLTPGQREALGEYGFHMYRLGAPTVADIDEIKYEGRLVVLDDGSRWEVSSLDVNDVDLWSPYGKAVVLDDIMYLLEDAEHADVTEET
jgi:hypothetical protein